MFDFRAQKHTQLPGKTAAKVPQIMQMEALECGAACLAMVCAYWGKWIPLEKVRVDCGVSRDGSNALKIVKAARNYGFTVRGLRTEPEALVKKGMFPCICHWELNHFIVLRGFKDDKVYINDPARGELCISDEEFDEKFTGIVLELSPDETFQPEGKPASIASFTKERLKGTSGALLFVALVAVVASLVGMLNPVFAQIFTDKLLSGTNLNWLTPFVAILAGIGFIEVLAEALDEVYLLRLEGKIAVSASAKYFWKVLHLPMEFFSQRLSSDILARGQSNAVVANQMATTLAPLAINAIMLVVYLVIMVTYSPLLAAIGIISSVINIFIARKISDSRVNITRVQMRDKAYLLNATVSGISMIETLKASGAEAGFFRRWSGFQANVNTQQVKFAFIDQALGLIPQLISSAASIAVLIIGVWLIIEGQFTVGMLLAFQGFLTQFVAPVDKLISSLQTFREMRTNMERIQDVMDYPTDPLAVEDEDIQTEEGGSLEKLRGGVDIVDLSFGYSPLDEPIVRDFNMHLEPGGSVALVGASGCGKSTIGKLISGVYQPRSGSILLDGKPLASIPRAVRCGSLAAIDQDIILFNDTIAANIRMWDKSIEDYEVVLAARDAGLHDAIMERSNDYDHILNEGGTNLSGGQRQRLEIARALAFDPSILILDEATSALDAQSEGEVMENIRRRGCTTIVIAHRLSAIRDCDEIIVIDKGSIVERGTHESLMSAGGKYAELVTSE